MGDVGFYPVEHLVGFRYVESLKVVWEGRLVNRMRLIVVFTHGIR